MLRKNLLVVLSFVFGLFGSVTAQDDIKFFNPEKFERATKTDDKGVIQWDEMKAEKCPTCSGSGKAKCTTCVRFGEDSKTCPECKRKEDREVVCRACAGIGSMSDPLEKVLCSGCKGAGFWLCMVCHGGGHLRVDKAKQWSACPGCRGEGGFKCGVCTGTRLVEAAGLKPSLKEAPVATLAKAIAATDQALKDLAVFTPAGGEKARKAVKSLTKTLDTVGAYHPAIKRTPKLLDDYMGKTYAGAQFQGHEEHEAEAMDLVKSNAEYYLKHQKRMLDLAHKRAEANAKLAAEQKGK